MTEFRMLSAAVSAIVLLPVGTAMAECPSSEAVGAMAADVLAGTQTAVPAVETMADGLCAQDMLVDILEAHWGAPVGYKIGLTSASSQERFGVEEPIRGVLLADMLLDDGATVAADYGARPLMEGDLIVVVGDAAINQATTPAEVLANLSEIRPFLELPDLVVADPGTLSGPVIAEINVAARYGVVGAPLAVEASDELLAALADMTVSVTAGGEDLASAPGGAVLGHPLNSVLWLIESGVELSEGDMVSVGSFGPLLPIPAGQTVTVSYAGLPGNPSVSASFE